jgi:hypothetical protein
MKNFKSHHISLQKPPHSLLFLFYLLANKSNGYTRMKRTDTYMGEITVSNPAETKKNAHRQLPVVPKTPI